MGGVFGWLQRYVPGHAQFAFMRGWDATLQTLQVGQQTTRQITNWVPYSISRFLSFPLTDVKPPRLNLGLNRRSTIVKV